MMSWLAGLLDLLDQRGGIDSLWVFGSEAEGRAVAGSDLDLAVLFRSRPSARELTGLRGEAEEHLGRPVDLVDLDAAPPLLAYQVLRQGRLLVDRNPSRRIALTASVPARREDVLLMRRPIEERLVQRIAGEQSSD
jgi:uncharacterized protein